MCNQAVFCMFLLLQIYFSACRFNSIANMFLTNVRLFCKAKVTPKYLHKSICTIFALFTEITIKSGIKKVEKIVIVSKI